MNTNERELVLKDEVYAIGLIINFKKAKLEWERIIHSNHSN